MVFARLALQIVTHAPHLELAIVAIADTASTTTNAMITAQLELTLAIQPVKIAQPIVQLAPQATSASLAIPDSTYNQEAVF